MKSKGTKLVKQIISMVTCVASAKSRAIRTKTDRMKARLMFTAFTVLSKKKKLSMAAAAVSGKIHDAIDGIFSKDAGDNDVDEEQISSKAIVLYNQSGGAEEVEEDDGKYPDLRHSLFDDEAEEELAELLEDTNSSVSVIDMVKSSRDQNGESFNLEDEIDQVADLFINKVRRRMRLQKLLSFKRHQQMMERSV